MAKQYVYVRVDVRVYTISVYENINALSLLLVYFYPSFDENKKQLDGWCCVRAASAVV